MLLTAGVSRSGYALRLLRIVYCRADSVYMGRAPHSLLHAVSMLVLTSLLLSSSGVSNTSALIKGISTEKCSSNEDALKDEIMTRINSDPGLCNAGLVANHLGGWTCERIGRKDSVFPFGNFANNGICKITGYSE